MPANFCCNPYGMHKAKCYKLLRQVTKIQASLSSLVAEGDYVCDNCRKRLTTCSKVVTPNPETPDPDSLPSTSGIKNSNENFEISTDGSFIRDSAEESAEESTADEFSTEVDEEITQPILNKFLPSLGQSPVKRSKRRNSMNYELHGSMYWKNFKFFNFLSLQRVFRNSRRAAK